MQSFERLITSKHCLFSARWCQEHFISPTAEKNELLLQLLKKSTHNLEQELQQLDEAAKRDNGHNSFAEVKSLRIGDSIKQLRSSIM